LKTCGCDIGAVLASKRNEEHMSVDSLDFISARDRQGIGHHQRYAEEQGSTFKVGGSRVLTTAEANKGVPEGSEEFFGEDGLTFEDVLDLINPLQHIPVVSTLYRSITGDEISHGARIFGGALYGGPIGLVSAVANSALDQVAGGDMGALALDMIEGDQGDSKPVMVAEVADTDPGLEPLDPDLVGTPPPGAGLVPSAWPQIEPNAGAPAAAPTDASTDIPELSERQATQLLSSLGIEPTPDVAPTATPPANAMADVAVPELSADQAALLLSSLGIEPAAGPAPTDKNASLVQRTAAPLPSPPIATLTAAGPDQQWIAEAMNRALDKYQSGHRAAADARANRVDTDL
jgi:hypothetical protein